MRIEIKLTEEEKRDIVVRYLSNNIVPQGYVLEDSYISLGEFIFTDKLDENELINADCK